MAPKRKHQEDGGASNGPSKSKRKYTDEDRRRASVYENLADDKHGTRIQAAKTLLEELAPANHPDVEKLKATVLRLLRGLCSGRKSARIGYFIAFSGLLQQTASSNTLFNQATGGIQELLKLINRLTKSDQGNPQENRDKHIGRVSAYKAILQSSILINDELGSEETWDFFIEQTSKHASSTPWLREECGSMLVDFVASASQDQSSIVKKIIERYSADGLLETAEGVALWLTTQKMHPDLKLPKDTWHKRDPLHSTERNRLARILCDSRGTSGPLQAGQQGSQKKVKTSGTWKPHPNFAWRVVLEQAFVRLSSVSKLRQFCIEILDNSLFAERASSERKYWGFSLLSWAIQNAPAESIAALFTPGFMRCLINHRVKADRELFLAAEGPLEAITTRGESVSATAIVLLEALLSSEAHANFDATTKSSTLSRLAGNIPEEGKSDMVRSLSDLISNPTLDGDSSIEDAEKARVVLANLLVSMVARFAKHHDTVELPWTRQVAQTLASFAYQKTSQAVPEITTASRTAFHDALIRCLNHLLPKLSEPSSWLAELVQHIQKSSEPSGHGLILKTDATVGRSIELSHETIQSIRKVLRKAKSDTASSLKILQLLLSLALLEAYSGDADAVDMLAELQTCYTSIKDDMDISQAYDLLVELLLSFLSKTSSLYTQIAEFVFPELADGMSGDGLASLLDIVSTRENISGQGELFDAADAGEVEEDESDDDDDDDDVSIDSDVEMISASEDEGEDKDNADEGESGDEDEEDAELQQFNDMLAQTLKTAKPGMNGKSTSGDSSEDESDMDDEQMKALDPHITKIFQERRKAEGISEGGSKKKERSKAKLQMTLFKSRVLDLLQIYVKKNHARPVVFEVLIPLLTLMRTTRNPDLEKKAKTTLGTWFETCDRNKEYPISPNNDDVWTLLRDIHAEVQEGGSKQHTMICSRASLFIAKMLVLADKSNMKRLIEEYGQTQLSVIEKAVQVQVSFFTEWCAWSLSWHKGSSKDSQEAEQSKTSIKEAAADGDKAVSDKVTPSKKKSKKNKEVNGVVA